MNKEYQALVDAIEAVNDASRKYMMTADKGYQPLRDHLTASLVGATVGLSHWKHKEALQRLVDQAEKDSRRLVWAMCNMTPTLTREFGMDVIRRGGTGDLGDCRTFIDQHLINNGEVHE